MNITGNNKEALCAMSGGVDSSVAAWLLQERGFDVCGITMKLFDDDILPEQTESGCCSLDDVEDAKSVCRKLGITHYTLNFKDQFSNKVIDTFCASYLDGRTPNPCIDCNRYLKFAGLQQRRRELGADFVATGHYARIRYDEQTSSWQLLRARDDTKDQSYVLYHLTQDDLAHMLFPLGELTKTEVRQIADKQGFVNARKRESQDICFVPDADYVGFIKRHEHVESEAAPFSPGPIVDIEGKRRGQHRGLIHYTTGQRKGIGVANPEPLYVIEKNLKTNELIVAPRSALLVQEVHVEDVNVISGDTSCAEYCVQAKTAYRQRATAATVQISDNGHAVIHFDEPQIKPAAGQAAVCYQGDVVLCGGTVASATSDLLT